MAAGGGSGGHVTPVLAVLRELKKHDKNLKAYFITDKAFGQQATGIIDTLNFKVPVKKINAGKFRRFHSVSVWKQIFNLPMTFKNIGDVFVTGVGLLQSVRYLRKVKPDVVFTKGGFVCLPVGLAASFLKIPLVIHDSDSLPGLTNKLLAKHATIIATGAPVENYPYPREKTHYVGVPVSAAFRPVTQQEKEKCRSVLGMVDIKKPLVVVTGGGLGARNLNRAIVSVAEPLLKKCSILHITGQSNYNEVMQRAPESADYVVKPFINGLALAFGGADVVVTRAGATTTSELAAMAKPTIIVPNPYLTGGHQIKNAEVFAKAGAAIVVQEDKIVMNPVILKLAIEKIIDDKKTMNDLSKAIYKFAKPDSAIDMAELIVSAAYKNKERA